MLLPEKFLHNAPAAPCPPCRCPGSLRRPGSFGCPGGGHLDGGDDGGPQHRRTLLYLKNVKREPYDGIKACFHDDSGAILVNGKSVADATEGRCKVLFSDPGRIADESSVAFSGPLDVVSFIDRSYYRHALKGD